MNDIDETLPKASRHFPGLPLNRRTKLALLIAAHNEELVLENTIRSALAAGMKPEHVYVVDDNSSDRTSAIAIAILGKRHVIRVGRSGKGLALTKARHYFNLTERYRWIHIADADGAFSPTYFTVFRKALRTKNAAATGYVRSLPGGPISKYRVMEYTVGQEIHRRFQALAHTVTVIPGPTSCFRADVFAAVDFANKTLTEDFDVTLQIHRQKLGHIQFIPQAVAFTQDPGTFNDYKRQITRWNRGLFQGVRRHRVGRRFNRLDAYMVYMILQNFTFFASYFILIPYFTVRSHSPNLLALTFLYDVLITFGVAVLVALKARRLDILGAYPHIWLFRFVSLYFFLRAFIEVGVLRRFGHSSGAWTSVQRYKPVG